MPLAPDIETMLTPQDRRYLKEHGIDLQTVEQHLATFRHGMPFTKLKRPCTLDDGIHRLTPSDMPTLIQHFEQARAAGRVTQFVPASGVATRMFHALQACCLTADSAGIAASDRRVLDQFLSNLQQFAFYHDLVNALNGQGYQLGQLLSTGHNRPILDTLLSAPGLNYARLPKGLIAFHRYAASTRTPIEEHLVDAAACTKDDQGLVRLHLTVSPEHRDAIQCHIEQACQKLDRHAVVWQVNCSIQHPSTDTIAVDMDNQLFHDSHGKLLFRPAGHGALLTNLHELGGDLVCIRNIDNVVPDHLKDTTCRYRKALGGFLVSVQDTLFAFLTRLEAESLSPATLKQITEWARHMLDMTLPEAWDTFPHAQQMRWLFTWLNRPLRVCGVVPNTGEPGGGPFRVEQRDGISALQIVECAQVDPDSPHQQGIFQSSTHFNPVDLVCGVRDYKGRLFDLHQFIDPHAGWVSKKSHEGKALKTLERSGLWNGAMAKWHSVFVEVPLHTFNPVKTVLDLLLPAHQPPDRG